MATGPALLYDFGLAGQLDGGSGQLREAGQVVANLGNGNEYSANGAWPLDLYIGGPGVEKPFTIYGSGPGRGSVAQSLDEVWFEMLHLFPKSIEFGQILTTVQYGLEIFNSFRDPAETHTITAFNNPIGAGLDIIDLPALPHDILYLDSLFLTLEATTDGVPTFEDYLSFDTDLYSLLLFVSGLRVIVFPYRPEVPIVERIAFLTDVLEHKDGSEQRISLRHSPRHTWEMRYIREDGVDKNKIEDLIFDWQHRIFGVPVWYEPTKLTADAAVNDLTINVESTAYADYRIGGLAVLLVDDNTFESLVIESFTATTITFASPLQNDYLANITEVYPMRPCYVKNDITGRDYPVNASEYAIQWLSQNNLADLADTAAFSTFNSKVLVDDANAVDGSMETRFIRDVIIIDNETGAINQESTWIKGKRGFMKGWRFSGSRQKLWETRQLLWALRGRQVSFYMPSFQKEFVLSQSLVLGQFTMTIANQGYTSYVKSRSPMNVLRVLLNDGTTIIRTISSSVEDSATEETLTLSSSWAANYAVSDVARIDLIELVRLDTDDIRIEHLSGVGDASIDVPVVSVFD